MYVRLMRTRMCIRISLGEIDYGCWSELVKFREALRYEISFRRTDAVFIDCGDTRRIFYVSFSFIRRKLVPQSKWFYPDSRITVIIFRLGYSTTKIIPRSENHLNTAQYPTRPLYTLPPVPRYSENREIPAKYVHHPSPQSSPSSRRL